MPGWGWGYGADQWGGGAAGGRLDHTFATGNGNPWVVIDFQQTASGLTAQTGGFTATQPNYVVDHWARGGVQIQTNFWDEHVLTDTVRANPAGWVAQDLVQLSTHPTFGGERLEPRAVDLRAFVLQSRFGDRPTVEVAPAALSRVARCRGTGRL